MYNTKRLYYPPIQQKAGFGTALVRFQPYNVQQWLELYGVPVVPVGCSFI